MSQSNSWFQQTPIWVWWSCFPFLGGFGIAYAGLKTSTNPWIGLGSGLVVASLIISSTSFAEWILLVWIIQIASAFILKNPFLVKTYPKHLPIPEDPVLAKQIAATRPKIDINACSKNDLVNVLGLPIVYANDIESLRNEGYIFTHLEELSEILDIPDSTLSRLAPLIVFSYNYRQEVDFSWKRLNTLSTSELINSGLAPEIAQAITAERERRGEYRSLIEIKKRTGIPFSAYRTLT